MANQVYYFSSYLFTQGASLSNYNSELIKMLETIKENRDDVQKEIDVEEEEKRQIEE